jgi:hypothetical protein
MSPFQLYFSFFTLIIGLAVSAVARGYGTLWQSRSRTRVGHLTPLLAAFLLLDMSRFWLALWNRQEIDSLGAVALASVLCVSLPYVFATTIMFPAHPDEWQSLDDYYLAHSRPIFLSLFVSKVSAYVFDALLFGWKPKLEDLPGMAFVMLPYIVMILHRSPSVQRWGLVFLVIWSASIFVATG